MQRAEECSKRLLGQMTTSTRRGYSLEKVISYLTQSMRRRTDEDARREHSITLPRSPYIILDDVRSLNENGDSDSDTRQARRAAISDSPKGDKLRVELDFPEAPHLPPPKKPDYSAARPPRRPEKRKRGPTDALLTGSQDEEDTSEDSGWRVTEDGKLMTKRVGRSLIRKPVDGVSSGLQQPHDISRTQQPTPLTKAPLARQDEPVSPKGRSRLDAEGTCDPPTRDGPAVAMLLRKVVDAFGDMPTLDNDRCASHRCCEVCRPKALRAFKVLQDMLLPCANDLEDVQIHRYNGGDIDTSQMSDDSPPRRRLTIGHPSVSICDSSDEEII